jgi:hypothetical protein
MKAGSEGVWKLVNLIVAVNFDGFLGGIQHHVALVAPMKMLIKLGLQALCNLAVQVVGQLLKEVVAFHW